MTIVIISESARADLRDITIYIARDNPERAASFVEELIEQVQVVGERPLSFAAKDDLHSGMRSATHGRYRIVFRSDDAKVTVLRVLHGVRDIRSIVSLK